MTDRPRNLRDDDRVDDALKAAFAEPSGSALEAIEHLSGTRSRVHLRDAPEDASPVLRMVNPAEHGPITDDDRYQVVGEIGRGGMGTVYKGRDRDLGRDVALKVLRADLATDPAVVQRFVEEAQVGGQLQHPGIVAIYGLGLQPDGRPFFAMKLVKGDTLASLLERGLDGSVAIGMFLRVAQTLAYAHSRHVIHRDLKPSNVMVGAFGEVQVVDWGFAKVLGREDTTERRPGDTIVATVRTDAEGSQSVAGSVMGTPAYMPPEQALGQIELVTERSDVFALGAILCELLTRQPLYAGNMQEQLLAAAQARLEKAHERLDACDAPEALKQIVRDCLEPMPADRPADAGVVAQRVADHLASVEERARQAAVDAVHAAAESRRVQRSRRTALALAAVILTAVVGGAGGLYAWSASERQRARAASAKVEPLLREATRLQGDGDLAAASTTARSALALARTEGADEETIETARELHARVEAAAAGAATRKAKAEREARLIDGLDEAVIRSPPLTPEQREVEFLTPFEAFGVDPRGADAAQALASFDRREELAGLLERWAEVRRLNDDERWRDLDRLARAIDDDPWRTRLRDAAARGDAVALRDIASHDEVGDQGSLTVAYLGLALSQADDPETALVVLRRAVRRHPDDFAIHGLLTHVYWWQLRRADDALPHVQAALALRPGSAALWNTLGAILNDGRKDHEGAARAFRKAIALVPEYGYFHANLGRALRGQDDIDGALAAYREATRLNAGDVETRGNLGGLLCDDLGRFDEALAVLDEALRVDPKSTFVLGNLGVVRRKMGDLDGAIAAQREVVRLDPKSVAPYLELGTTLGMKGDAAGALAAYAEALRLDPNDARVHWHIGVLRHDGGEWEAAIAAYRKAIEVDATYVKAHYNLGAALEERGDIEGALAEYRTTLRLDPTLAEAYESLGRALHLTGDREGAVAAMREAVARRPDSIELVSRLADLLAAKGDIGAAIAVFRDAIARQPDGAVLHCGLGRMLAAKGDLDGAVAAQREALRLDPNNARARCNLGIVLFEKRDLEGALAAQREAIRLDPNLGPAHCNLGIVLNAKGDLDGAIAAQRAAIRVEPRLVPAHVNLAAALEAKGDIDGTLAALRELAALLPNRPEPHEEIGRLLSEKGDIPGAIAAFSEAVRIDPRSARSHFNLGVALLSSGDLAGSLSACEKGLALAPGQPRLMQIRDQAQRLSTAAARLPAVLAGTDQPKDTKEWLTLVEAARVVKNHAASARCWQGAFAVDPGLAADPRAGHRYNAACAAALAGPKWHDQALEWLRADLRGWQELGKTEPKAATETLRWWKTDSDLAAVRDANPLPQEWCALWADVDRLLEQVQAAADPR